MTYQLILCARDGCALASDQREHLVPDSAGGEEGEGAKVNLVKKIRLDPDARYAWAFSGGRLSITASGLLERHFEARESDVDIGKLLRKCGDQAWSLAATGPDNSSKILLVDGRTNMILRANISPATTVDAIAGNRCDAGQTYSKASIYPQLFYAPSMSVDEVAALAAYTVWLAGQLDPLLVSGLDLAIYRQSTGKFELADSNIYLEKAKALHERIRGCLLSVE